MPIPGIGKDLYIAISPPFSFSFPVADSGDDYDYYGRQARSRNNDEYDYFDDAASARQSRSFNSAKLVSEKRTLFSLATHYMGQLGVDGHACLLRSMCEMGSTPQHGEGLLGDVLNVLLSTASKLEVDGPNSDFKEYVEAELDGKVSKSHF